MISNWQFNHIGIATRSIEATCNLYANMGYSRSEIYIDEFQKVKIQFLTHMNSPMIELIEPISSISPISKILDKNGVTPYHICYEVIDFELSINNLTKNNFIKLSKPLNAVAFNNRRIIFLYNTSFGLIELLEHITI